MKQSYWVNVYGWQSHRLRILGCKCETREKAVLSCIPSHLLYRLKVTPK